MTETRREIRVIPVLGVPEVRTGDVLEQILSPALDCAGVREGDVVCVSTKIVSKALGLVVDPAQRDEAVRRSSVRVVARRLHTRVVTTIAQIPSGPVMAAAGVDSSNAPGGPLMLPEDPDACADALREGLEAALGLRLAVVLTDTSSRVWRVGVGDIALGASGLRSLDDLRGSSDSHGARLSVTVRNLADEIAAAADLVKGKSAQIPAALVRGLDRHVVDRSEHIPASALSRPPVEDWFRRPSLESVWQALGVPTEGEPVARMSPEPDQERIARALAVARQDREDGIGPVTSQAGTAWAVQIAPHRIEVRPGGTSPSAWAGAGVLTERIRTALGAESIQAPLPPVEVTVVPPDQGAVERTGESTAGKRTTTTAPTSAEEHR